jgi:hypothetical protein
MRAVDPDPDADADAGATVIGIESLTALASSTLTLSVSGGKTSPVYPVKKRRRAKIGNKNSSSRRDIV